MASTIGRYFGITLCILVLLACDSNQTRSVQLHNPVIRTDLITLNGSGKVKSFKGRIFVQKMRSIEDLRQIRIGDEVTEETILFLDSQSQVSINVGDAQIIDLHGTEGAGVFTFDIK